MAETAAVILGCRGQILSAAEEAFFRDLDPLGFILFQRNCESPEQVRRLIVSLRECVGRSEAPILIDQEGGRVARLKPPHWCILPAAGAIAALHARDPEPGLEAAWCAGRLAASELQPLGIDVNCAPVVDVLCPGAHPTAIGDRSYGTDPALVTALAGAYMEGLLAGGVLPVIKHIPGHGRAEADSHFDLPVVRAGAEELEASDLVPFRDLSGAPIAMTAHVLYPAWDAAMPATLSSFIIRDVIRGQCRFRGLLLSDDLSMNALAGSLRERAAGSLRAGCDVALHCNGDMEEMKQVASGVGGLLPEASERWGRARQRLQAPDSADGAALAARLHALLER